MSTITWVLESAVFPISHQGLRNAITKEGHALIDWDDSWTSDGVPKTIGHAPVIFHGSLGNAAFVDRQLNWQPGAFCNVEKFQCSAWYESVQEWLLNDHWRKLTVKELVQDSKQIARELGASQQIFVRPDSPLKPFSGRVLDVSAITLKSLDHGFYFEDEKLPVIISPVKQVTREWRFIVVRSQVITGCEYVPAGRLGSADAVDSSVWEFAQQIATQLSPPADVYVLDLCESEGNLRLLELNLFGGADLYLCDPDSIVREISKHALDS